MRILALKREAIPRMRNNERGQSIRAESANPARRPCVVNFRALWNRSSNFKPFHSHDRMSLLPTSVPPPRAPRTTSFGPCAAAGFAENGLVGRSLRVGSKVVISILERDPRCVMITLDPDTGESIPELLRQVAKAHSATAGVYAAVLVEGILRKGDAVELLE